MKRFWWVLRAMLYFRYAHKCSWRSSWEFAELLYTQSSTWRSYFGTGGSPRSAVAEYAKRYLTHTK